MMIFRLYFLLFPKISHSAFAHDYRHLIALAAPLNIMPSAAFLAAMTFLPIMTTRRKYFLRFSIIMQALVCQFPVKFRRRRMFGAFKLTAALKVDGVAPTPCAHARCLLRSLFRGITMKRPHGHIFAGAAHDFADMDISPRLAAIAYIGDRASRYTGALLPLTKLASCYNI